MQIPVLAEFSLDKELLSCHSPPRCILMNSKDVIFNKRVDVENRSKGTMEGHFSSRSTEKFAEDRVIQRLCHIEVLGRPRMDITVQPRRAMVKNPKLDFFSVNPLVIRSAGFCVVTKYLK